MREPFTTETHARLRIWLATGYTLFIVYASLSPFSGWREQGLDFAEVLGAPLPPSFSAFDVAVNVLAYIPFGLLICLALRARFNAIISLALGTVLGTLLSGGMEYLQMYLPMRFSSNLDLLANGAGTLIGALLAVSITSWAWLVLRLTNWRSGLFHHGREMDFGLALLALWMFGQINPSLPMLGHVFISETARQPFVAAPAAPFDWLASGAVTLNLLMLGTLLLTLLRAPRNIAAALLAVLSIVALAKFITAAVLLKSWALLLWINGEAMLGVLLGMVLLFAAPRLPHAVMIFFGATIALAYLCIINFVLEGNAPSSAMSIYYWHYGHLLNYNGLAQTIILIFPALLLIHLWLMRKV
ncbi:MAG: VanZ family protein [Gallionellaceae bacterium]|nr:VanZ family protein [Gallionellaceae bacterium]